MLLDVADGWVIEKLSDLGAESLIAKLTDLRGRGWKFYLDELNEHTNKHSDLTVISLSSDYKELLTLKGINNLDGLQEL
jgi:hypothetical protein